MSPVRPSALAAALVVLAPLAAPAQDGTPDPSFSGDGHLVVELGPTWPNSHGSHVEPLADGRILVAGRACAGDCQPAAVRLLPNGAFDTTFSVDGKVAFPYANLPNGYVAAAHVRSDGKTVFAGQLNVAGGQEAMVGLARLTANGLFDAAFGAPATPGSIHHALPGGDVAFVDTFEMQSDGKLLVGGTGRQTGFIDYDFFVARFTETGQLDPTYSGDGVAWIAIDNGGAHDDSLSAMAIQPDDRIVLAGQSADGSGDADTGLARLTTTGSLDPTFDGDSGIGNGRVVWEQTDVFGDVDDYPRSIVVQPDGRIVFAGTYTGATSGRYFARVLSTGATDPSLVLGVPTVAPWEIFRQADGKLVLVGGPSGGNGCQAERFDANGTAHDPTFGVGGVVSFAPGPNVTDCRAAALSGQKIVAAGAYYVGPNGDLYVARLNSAIFRDGFASGNTSAWSSTTP